MHARRQRIEIGVQALGMVPQIADQSLDQCAPGLALGRIQAFAYAFRRRGNVLDFLPHFAHGGGGSALVVAEPGPVPQQGGRRCGAGNDEKQQGVDLGAEPPPARRRFFQLVAQHEHLVAQLLAIGEFVPQLIGLLQIAATVGLQPAPFGLKRRGILDGAVVRQVQLCRQSVARGFVGGEEGPHLLAHALREQQFVLAIQHAPERGIDVGRFGAIADTDDLDQPVAVRDLPAQSGTQFAVTGREVVLGQRREAELGEEIGQVAAQRTEFVADCRDIDAGFQRGSGPLSQTMPKLAFPLMQVAAVPRVTAGAMHRAGRCRLSWPAVRTGYR